MKKKSITYIYRVTILFSVLLSTCATWELLTSCNKKKNVDIGRLEQLRSEATNAAMRRNFKASDSIGRLLYTAALKAEDDVYQSYGLLAQSYYTYSTERAEERMGIALKALEKALQTDNDTLKSRVYNVLGGYSTLHFYDFAQAIHYFSEAKRYAEAAGARDFVMAAECNISEIYHSIGDTLGLPYDIDIYNFAKETGQYNFLVPAAQHMSEYYLSNSNTAHLALQYIADVDSAESPYLYNRLMGDYYKVKGESSQAARCYNKAIDACDNSVGVYLSYADLLNQQHDYTGSLIHLDKARTLLNECSVYNTARTRMYELYADNYAKLGQYKESMNYLEKYISLRDSITKFRNDEQVNRFRIRYETGKKELEIARSHAAIRIRNIILITLACLSVIVILLITIYYRKRNRLLSVIVERQKRLTNLKNDEEQRDASSLRSESVSVFPEVNASNPEATASSEETNESSSERGGLSDAKSAEIWSRICHEMDVNHIYRDPSVSRDMFANRVGCNHTWFSQVIKEHTGKTYPQFMNSRRVEEALDILSDPTSRITHEELWRTLGFLSKATFYSSFKAQMAMSPAEYRRRALTEKN